MIIEKLELSSKKSLLFILNSDYIVPSFFFFFFHYHIDVVWLLEQAMYHPQHCRQQNLRSFFIVFK